MCYGLPFCSKRLIKWILMKQLELNVVVEQQLIVEHEILGQVEIVGLKSVVLEVTRNWYQVDFVVEPGLVHGQEISLVFVLTIQRGLWNARLIDGTRVELVHVVD